MGASFHYIVKAKLIRFIKDGVIDFFEINKEFKNDNPIEAREQAFTVYQNNIDVLLQGIKKNYFNDKQTREDLIPFVDSQMMTKWEELFGDFEIPNSYGNGIGIYMVINKPIEDEIFEDKIGDECMIHGINFGSADPQTLMDGLNHEYLYYKQFNYSTKNDVIKVKFYDADAEEVYDETILKTPFDWTGYDIPSIENQDISEESVDKKSSLYLEKFIDYIEYGEGNQIEFKASLITYKNENKIGYSRHIIFKIIKAIASFLNSNGGLLFIGVNDDKSINGLDVDFSLALTNSEDPKDFFKKQVDYIIKNNFKPYATFIKGNFVEVEDKLIYVFIIEPSPKPVFVLNTTDKEASNHKKEFYVRLTGASSIHYYDTEEVVEYCLNHWRK